MDLLRTVVLCVWAIFLTLQGEVHGIVKRQTSTGRRIPAQRRNFVPYHVTFQTTPSEEEDVSPLHMMSSTRSPFRGPGTNRNRGQFSYQDHVVPVEELIGRGNLGGQLPPLTQSSLSEPTQAYSSPSRRPLIRIRTRPTTETASVFPPASENHQELPILQQQRPRFRPVPDLEQGSLPEDVNNREYRPTRPVNYRNWNRLVTQNPYNVPSQPQDYPLPVRPGNVRSYASNSEDYATDQSPVPAPPPQQQSSIRRPPHVPRDRTRFTTPTATDEDPTQEDSYNVAPVPKPRAGGRSRARPVIPREPVPSPDYDYMREPSPPVSTIQRQHGNVRVASTRNNRGRQRVQSPQPPPYEEPLPTDNPVIVPPPAAPQRTRLRGRFRATLPEETPEYTSNVGDDSYIEESEGASRHSGRGVSNRGRHRQYLPEYPPEEQEPPIHRPNYRTTTRPRPVVTTPVHESDYYAEDYYDDGSDPDLPPSTAPPLRPPRPSGVNPRYRGRFRVDEHQYDDDHYLPPASHRRPVQSPSNPRPTKATTTTTTTTTPKPNRNLKPRKDGRVIDFLGDPNFPRELTGVDLTDYPFYISVPDDITFKCEDRHDGFYASIPHRCQLFHYCFGSIRYSFLCPNYTLYDQTTFTCRFVNTVDCEKSEQHYDRNNELYVEKTTAAPSSTSPKEEKKRESRDIKNQVPGLRQTTGSNKEHAIPISVH